MSEYHKKKNKNSLFKRIYQAISSPIAFLASIITIIMVIADTIPIITMKQNLPGSQKSVDCPYQT